MRKVINITDKQFGRLTVTKYMGTDKHNNALWQCTCSCGNIIITRGATLRSGRTRSCGCLHKEAAKKLAKTNIKHSKSGTRLYRTWQSMKSRCYYQKNNRYKYYGARGIKVCDDWLHNFQAFYNWAMENGYQENLTIERICIDRNYEPSNCKWITKEAQQRNKRNNKMHTINGEAHCLSEWCEILNLNYNTVQTRLHRSWPIEKALELL